jgi:iron complex outermembrane recepter protein
MRKIPLQLSVLSSALLFSLAALAQQPSEDSSKSEEEDTVELEQVTVTGSRIPRQGFVAPTPVTVLGEAEIARSGAITIGDLVNQLPALGSTFSLSNSSRFIGTVGLGLLDLRRLGTVRTLVLVNGRRHVAANAGTSSVDTNTIPVEWVERVEVITGGASAIYGADAVSGVVNFVLKKSFKGMEIRTQYGKADEGGFDRAFTSLTAGSDFADGRGTIGFSMEVSTQDRFKFTDREITRVSYRNIQIPGTSNRVTAPNAGLFSLSEGGRFTLGGVPYVFDADGSVRRQNLGTFRDATGCQNCDFLDLGRVADLQPSFDRASFNSAGRFTLNDDHNLFFEAKYVRTESTFAGQPSFDQGTIRIAADNAYLTPQIRTTLGNFTTPLAISRFNTDLGQRGEDVTRQTARFVLGMEGALGENWTYELSANHGRNGEDRTNQNNRINERWFASIDAVRDPAGNIVCRSVLNPTSINTSLNRTISDFARIGCVPTSIFGNGAVNQNAAAFINAQSLSSTTLTQTVFAGSVATSSLFDLPAGGVGFAAGVETRKETSNQKTDALSAAGLTFLNAIPNRRGEYTVDEAFAEFSIPLLSGVSLVDSLIFDVAGRYSDYSTIGDTTTWKVGLDWTVFEDLRVRTTYAEAIRAPNIAELFNPQSENFFPITDPCSASRILLNAVRSANCRALGIPAAYESTVAATRRGLSGGNPDLLPEESESFSVGFVYQPSWFENFGLTVDYWDIEITDAIGSVSGQTNADRCVDSRTGIDNRFCRAITRDPTTFEVVFVRAITENLQKLASEGIDLEVSYKFENLYGGDLTVSSLGTYLMNRKTFAFQEDPANFTDSRGVLGDPKIEANVSFAYARGPWTVSWETRYLEDQLLVSRESFVQSPDQVVPIRAGKVAYSDAQLRYKFNDHAEIYGGIDNLLDKNPPAYLTGSGADSAVYDNIGRFGYLGLNYKF